MVPLPSTRVLVLLLCVTALGGCSNAPAQNSGGPLSAEQAAYDVTYYDLAVGVSPQRERIEGRLDVHAVVETPLEVLILDLDHRFSVQQAWTLKEENGESLPVERSGENQLRISFEEQRFPGDTLRVAVQYAGSPRVAPSPPWDGGFTWAKTPNGEPWIATSCQTEGADLWWPVKDHPSDEPDSMDVAITVPDRLEAVSNGTLQSVERATDTTQTYQWHVSTPINMYAVALNVAPYVRLDTTYAGTAGTQIPVSFYALPTDSAQARRALPRFLDQLRFLERTLGPYPFRRDKYGIAQTPFLGMEHQTIIAYGHDFTTGGLGYDASFDALHFHELAHEWYGNLATVADWKDFWLHEGSTTYLEALYAEHLQGDSAYHALTDDFRSQVEGGTPIAHSTPTTAQGMYHRDVYYKGALVLHTLRYMIGETATRTLLRRFVYPNGAASNAEPPFRHVTTSDFIRTAERIAGRPLDAFFQVYLYQAALPVLETTRSGDTLTLRWTSTGDAAFEVPVPIAIGDSTQEVRMSGGTAQLTVPESADVQVDPKGWILRARHTEQ